LPVQNSSVARSAIDVGTVIAGTYTIEALIGRGGMGAVFLASHNRLSGKKVAIKVLHAELADAEVLARFEREANIASELAHPNIVNVTDYNVLPDGTPYLVLEYLEGETLAGRLRRGPLELAHAMSIVRQVGSALAAAHRAGIVHRDLKPQNIFLAPTEVDGRVVELAKVLDFGISKIRGSQTVKTQDSTLLGTPQYMAPEQATGQHANVDERTDVFALGVIVYEMLTGEPAFTGASIPEVVFKVVYEEPRSLAEQAPDTPKQVLDAVATAMKKSALERFPTVNSFVEALTGQPLLSNVRIPTLNRPELGAGTGGSSRRSLEEDAFAQTMGSGDGSAPVPEVSPQAKTVPSEPGAQKAGVPTVKAPVPPAKRPIGLIIGLGLACAGAIGVAVYFATRTPPAPPAIAEPTPSKPDKPVGHAGDRPVDHSGDTSVDHSGGKPVDHGGDKPLDHSSTQPAPPIDAGATKRGSNDTKAPPRGSDDTKAPPPETGPEVDAARQQLEQAETALAKNDVDLAWRLANAVINTGPASMKAQAYAIHGVLSCTEHNDAEGAGIDLRHLGRGAARQRILKACHERDLLMEER
jgi:serine/threonine-protein kinase